MHTDLTEEIGEKEILSIYLDDVKRRQPRLTETLLNLGTFGPVSYMSGSSAVYKSKGKARNLVSCHQCLSKSFWALAFHPVPSTEDKISMLNAGSAISRTTTTSQSYPPHPV